MILSRFALLAAVVIAPCALAGGPPFAVQRVSDGSIITRTYPGQPYTIPGYRWLEIVPLPRPPIDDRISALLPCHTVPADERVDLADPTAVDCADSQGADELVRLASPTPTDPAAIAGTLYTGIVQVGWQDTGDEPVQTLALLPQIAEAQRLHCTEIAASPTVCSGMDGLLARRDQGYPLTTADTSRIARCAAASAVCDTPCETRRAQLEEAIRTAYAGRTLPLEQRPPIPDLDTGWPDPEPLP